MLPEAVGNATALPTGYSKTTSGNLPRYLRFSLSFSSTMTTYFETVKRVTTLL